MPDLLTEELESTLVDLVNRSGLLSQPGGREAMLIGIGLEPANYSVGDTTPHDFAVLLIHGMNQQGNRTALGRMFCKIADRMPGRKEEWPPFERVFGPCCPKSNVPAPVPGQTAADGVTALKGLADDSSEIRDAAATFRAVFQSASDQIQDVSEYKNLHDQLHELQIKCYDVIAANAARFPGDEDAKTDLEECRLTFEGVLEQLRAIAGRFYRVDTNWIQQLDAALLDLCNALKRDDPILLKQALRKMDRELSLRPPQINIRLNQSARTLNLTELVQVLSRVRDYAARLDPDSTKMREFKAGVEALARMDASLSALIRLHDRWQDADTELRAMEKDSKNPQELGYWWPDFKPKALEICKAVSGDWAASFQSYGENLELAINANDSAKTRKFFRLIRHSVTIRFYKTDTDLKSQCDELLKVGEPLTTVLRVI